MHTCLCVWMTTTRRRRYFINIKTLYIYYQRLSILDDFFPPKQCIEDIIDAYNGNTSGLAERGINYENGVTLNTPAKIYEKRMFGSDGKGKILSKRQSIYTFILNKLI